MEPDCSFPDLARRPWWRRRFFKAIVIAILSVAAFYIVELQLGERSWKAYQREAAANGRKIRLADFEVPGIPDEENFAAVPIFRSLFDDALAVDRTHKLLKLPAWPPQKKKEPKPDYLTGWQQAFVRAGWIPAASDNAASDVLMGLERMQPTLTEIRLACARPRTQWPIKWSDGAEAKAPILTALDRAGTALGLRARALLELGRSDEALDEIRNIARLAESLNDQPMLSFGAIRTRLWDVALERAEFGLKAHKWSASQVEALLKLFSINHLATWKVSLTGDRGLMNDYLDKLMSADSGAFGTQLQALYAYGSSQSSLNKLWSIAPRGWIRRSQVMYNRCVDSELDEIDSERERINSQFNNTFSRPYYPGLPFAQFYPANRLADAGSGSRKYSEIRAFARHTRARQFPILCALVNYRDARGEFPESLDQLVPSFLSAVPHDIMDGKPMRYRRLENGGCMVWSIADNRVDDGGKKPEPNRSLGPDWVGELPPPKASGAN